MENRLACISIADVQHAVARTFRLSVGEILSRKRRHRLAGARQVAMYLSRELAGGGWTGPRRQAASFPRIGMAFARDHTSVIHACNVVAHRRDADPEFARMLDRIAHELTAEPQASGAACNTAVSIWYRPVPIRNLRAGIASDTAAAAVEALPERQEHFALHDEAGAEGAERRMNRTGGR
jgi:DnaA-like protein